MKSILALLFFLVFISSIYGQQAKLDSINRLIRQASSDTARINRLNVKTGLLSEINLDSALLISAKTIQDAQRINYKQGEALARVRLAHCYNYKGNYGEALQNLKQAESIYSSLNDSPGLGKVYNTYGTLYGMQSKYDSSIIYFRKGVAIAERDGDKNGLSRLYMNIGVSYDMLSNRPQALQYQHKALTLAQEANNVNQQAYCLVNLANLYKAAGSLQDAEQYYRQSIELSRQAAIKNVELYAYTNLAALYTEKHATKQAYTVALKAASLAKQMGDAGIQATSLSRAAVNLAEEKNYAEAQRLNKRAMAIADSSQQPLNIHQAYASMGQILKMQANYAGAIPYYEKSFQVLKNADIYDDQTGKVYAELSDCYEKAGNYRQALAAYKTAASISDSVRGKENIQKTTELRMTYAFDKKQQAVQAEQQKQNAVASSRQLALSIGLGLMVVLAAVSVYAYSLKQKANTMLQVQKDELERTLTQLQSAQTQLIQSEKMASLGELTAGIAHELQNPLNFVNNFAKLSTELVQDLQSERQNETRDETEEEELISSLSVNLTKINHHGEQASSIVKNMLEHARTSTGAKQLTDLNALGKDYMNLSYQGFRAKDKEFDCELIIQLDGTLPKVDAVPQDLGRVFLNLFNNAFYAVSQKRKAGVDGYRPAVMLSTDYHNGQVEIRVRDNGTGIPQPVLAKVFQPFFTTKPPGQGTGLGLSLSYDIVAKGHGGQLSVDTQAGEFSEFIVRLPFVG